MIWYALIFLLLYTPYPSKMLVLKFESDQYVVNLSSGFLVKDYKSAHEQCEKRNSHLAVLNNQQVFDLLTVKLSIPMEKRPRYLFVGLQRTDSNRLGFVWNDGSALKLNYNVSQWYNKEPKRGSQENCVVLDQKLKQFKTTNCSITEAGYICQSFKFSNPDIYKGHWHKPTEFAINTANASSAISKFLFNIEELFPSFAEQQIENSSEADNSNSSGRASIKGLVIAIGGPAGVLTIFGIIMVVLIRCNKSKKQKEDPYYYYQPDIYDQVDPRNPPQTQQTNQQQQQSKPKPQNNQGKPTAGNQTNNKYDDENLYYSDIYIYSEVDITEDQPQKPHATSKPGKNQKAKKK